MFHFALYEDKRLTHFKNAEKRAVIGQAIKLYRADHPLNWKKRLTLVLLIVCLPALLIYLFHGTNYIVSWMCVSSMIVAYKLDSQEAPEIIPYLDKAIR